MALDSITCCCHKHSHSSDLVSGFYESSPRWPGSLFLSHHLLIFFHRLAPLLSCHNGPGLGPGQCPAASVTTMLRNRMLNNGTVMLQMIYQTAIGTSPISSSSSSSDVTSSDGPCYNMVEHGELRLPFFTKVHWSFKKFALPFALA